MISPIVIMIYFMSPEFKLTSIRTGEERKFIVPDETGIHTTPYGRIFIDMSGIAPRNQEQTIVVRGKGVGLKHGKTREICLSPEGIGSTRIGSFERLEVKLNSGPVRSNNEWHRRRFGYIVRGGQRHTVYRWHPIQNRKAP